MEKIYCNLHEVEKTLRGMDWFLDVFNQDGGGEWNIPSGPDACNYVLDITILDLFAFDKYAEEKIRQYEESIGNFLALPYFTDASKEEYLEGCIIMDQPGLNGVYVSRLEWICYAQKRMQQALSDYKNGTYAPDLEGALAAQATVAAGLNEVCLEKSGGKRGYVPHYDDLREAIKIVTQGKKE